MMVGKHVSKQHAWWLEQDAESSHHQTQAWNRVWNGSRWSCASFRVPHHWNLPKQQHPLGAMFSEPQAQVRNPVSQKQKPQVKQKQDGHMCTWPLKPNPSGTPSPTRPHLLVLPKQYHQLGTTYSNASTYQTTTGLIIEQETQFQPLASMCAHTFTCTSTHKHRNTKLYSTSWFHCVCDTVCIALITVVCHVLGLF